MKNKFKLSLMTLALVSTLAACSTPEEKAQKYYQKGMALLEKDPAKAKLEFQNSLQINKKNNIDALYGLSLVAERQADWKANYAILNAILEQNPRHLMATVKIGQLFLTAGNIEQAKTKLLSAKEIAPDDKAVILFESAFELKNKNYDLAVAKAKQVLEKDSKSQEAYLVLASERYSAKDYPQSIKFLDQGLALNPKNLVMHLLKVQVIETTGDIQKAEAAHKEVINLFPENFSLRTKLAEFYYNYNKKDEAEKELRFVTSKWGNLQPKLDLVKFIAATKGVAEATKELETMVNNEPNNYELGFKLVQLYDSQNNSAASGDLLNKIIKTAENKPDGLKAKAIVAYRLSKKDKTQANKLVEEILKVDSANQDALMLKAGMQLDSADIDNAILTIRTVLRDQPNSSRALFMLARTYELSGSNALAEESYVSALKASKFEPNIGISYAQLLIRTNEHDRAEKTLEDVLKRYPLDQETIKQLAQIKIGKNDLAGAQALADRYKDIQSSNLSKLIEGAIALRKNDYAAGMASFNAAHKMAPNDMQAIMAVVQLYVSQKKYNEAQTFISGIQNGANSNQMKMLSAQIYALAGDKNKAVSAYESIITENPSSISAYYDLARFHFSGGDIESAKSTINKGLVAIPNSADLKMALAEIHQNNQSYGDAIAIYQDILKSNPDSFVALNNYVSIVSDYETDVAKITKAYESAERLKNTNVPQFLDTLGWAAYRIGKYDQALDLISSAANKMPEHAVFQYHLGKVYLARDSKQKAKEAFEKALQLSKNQNVDYSADIKKLLETI